MRTVVLILFYVYASLFGQAYANNYYDGVVVLSNKEVIVGRVSVVSFQVVVVESSASRDVYPSHQVREVRFFDKEHNINRKFISLPISDNFANEFSFFEEIVFGEALVLRKPKRNSCINETLSVLDHSDFDYYIVWEGNLIPTNRFSKEVFPQVRQLYETEVTSYMADKKLNLYRAGDVIELIRFYNKIVKSAKFLADL